MFVMCFHTLNPKPYTLITFLAGVWDLADGIPVRPSRMALSDMTYSKLLKEII